MKSIITITAALLASIFSLHAFEMKQGKYPTRWADKIDIKCPLPEYPRPQLVRPDWVNLNGIWEFQEGSKDELPPFGKKLIDEILVPYPMESCLSGIMKYSEYSWYRRNIKIPESWKGKKVILNFGAVDYEAEVFINGKSLGIHKGGYVPFSFDISPFIKDSASQELIVRVFDPTDNMGIPRGKQTLYPHGIMYTSVSGIWQTVWIECVSDTYIKNIKMTPDIDAKVLKITVNSDKGAKIKVKVKIKDKVISENEFVSNDEALIKIENPVLWNPENPFLYDLELYLEKDGKQLDKVESYFAMRKISLGEENGFKKIFLNNEFVFQKGLLDQGFWPDGIYTAPTDEALRYDLEMTKAFGYNLARKHIKVEPARWYYWADKLGVLVWQDMPSVNSYLDKKNNQKAMPIEKDLFERELREMIRALYNTPSIIMWVLFNENQGAHDVERLLGVITEEDNTRIVNEGSGGPLTGRGDVLDIHRYPQPDCPEPNRTRATVLGEYGGIGYIVNDYNWDDRKFAYGENCTSADELLERYKGYMGMMKEFKDKYYLSAYIYTETTDVEREINGLLTYDRNPKVDPEKIKKINDFDFVIPKYKALLETSEREPKLWKYTFEAPMKDWNTERFNDRRWKEGFAPFGKYKQLGKTEWKAKDIWMRKKFETNFLTHELLEKLVLKEFHDEDFEVYINGILAYKGKGYLTRYTYVEISDEAKKSIRLNDENTIAVHCKNTVHGQFIDVGLYIKE